MKKVLVTGAGGFIGSALVKTLLDNGYLVYALIKKGNFKSQETLLAISDKIIIINDLQQLMSQEFIPRFDIIYHLATVGICPDFNDIDLICDVNIKLGCQLIDFVAKTQSSLFVNFGSCFEYGDHGDKLLTEDMVCRPESLYAISKNASVNLINCYAKMRNVNVITVRPFGVFGEGEATNRLAPSIIRSCLEGKAIKTTSGEQIRDFVNVKDLVKAIFLLSVSNYEPYEIYNVCSNNPVTVKNFIEEIVDVCKLKKELILFGNIPYRKNEAMIFAGDNTKLQKIINYPFPNDHREGILDIYNSIMNNDR